MHTIPAVVFFVLSVSIGVGMAGLGIIWPLLPVLATQLGAGGSGIGVIIASYNISRTVLSPFVGNISDKFGRKHFIVLGLVATGILSFTYVYSDTMASMIAIRVLHGFASLLIVPIVLALAADISPKETLGATMGTLNMAAMLGLGIGPALGGAIQTHLGMNTAFYFVGVLALATAALVAFCIPPDAQTRPEKRGEHRASFREIVTHRTAFAIILMRFFTASGQGAVYTFLPIYALEINMPSTQLGIILSCNVFMIALLQRPVGKFADRINPKGIVIWGVLASAVTVFCMPFVEDFVLILILNLLMGAANGLVLPGSLTITGHLGRTMGMASLMSVTDAAWSLGMIVSPVLSGAILDTLGISYVFTIGSGLIALGGVAVALLLRDYTPAACE